MSRGGGSGRLRRFGGRLGRLVRGLVLVLLGLAAVVALGLALAPVRGALLGLALGVVDRALPGSLTVAAKAWPRPGTIELEDVVWVHTAPGAAPDTLVHARRVVVTVELGALRYRDLVADSLFLDLAGFDLPAIAALFPPQPAVPDTAPAAADPAARSGSFPRPGSLGGAPSAAVHRLVVVLESATLAPDLTVHGLRLQGRAGVQAGRSPHLELRLGPATLRREGGGPAGAEPLAVELTHLFLVAGRDQARGPIRVDSLDVEIAAAGPPDLVERWRGLPPLALSGTGRV
ncbi:MAG: hypothetical protein IH621_16940, partial [Krumholzibacteria bacterium]|nr:hypothetical protein [Candidatus Krumholzibacteria bacterium]